MAGKKLVNVCPIGCSYHPDKIGEDKAKALLSLRMSEIGIRKYSEQASLVLGKPMPYANAQRHVKHYREELPEDGPSEAPPGEKVSDLQILDAIIAAGARNSRSWKPSIKDTLDAMRLKIQITGNSAFEDMLAAMEAGLSLAEGAEEEVLVENPAARGLADEISDDSAADE